MLEGIRERGVKIALISNCFTEEASLQPVGRLPEFESVNNPMDVIMYL